MPTIFVSTVCGARFSGPSWPPWAARDVVNTKHSECYGIVRSLKGSLRLDSHRLSHPRFFLGRICCELGLGVMEPSCGPCCVGFGLSQALADEYWVSQGASRVVLGLAEAPWGGPDGSRGAQRNFEVAWGQLLLHRPAVLCWGSIPRGYHGAQRSPEDASGILNSLEEFSLVLTAPEGPAGIPYGSRWFLRGHAGPR